MSERMVTVWFTAKSTYYQRLNLDSLAEQGAPVDSVDSLADWLEGAYGLDWLTENAKEHDFQVDSAEVYEIEGMDE